jgi:hypothetical protein
MIVYGQKNKTTMGEYGCGMGLSVSLTPKYRSKSHYEYVTHYDMLFTANNSTRCGLVNSLEWQIAK